jgi:hypothetical protein
VRFEADRPAELTADVSIVSDVSAETENSRIPEPLAQAELSEEVRELPAQIAAGEYRNLLRVEVFRVLFGYSRPAAG